MTPAPICQMSNLYHLDNLHLNHNTVLFPILRDLASNLNRTKILHLMKSVFRTHPQFPHVKIMTKLSLLFKAQTDWHHHLILVDLNFMPDDNKIDQIIQDLLLALLAILSNNFYKPFLFFHFIYVSIISGLYTIFSSICFSSNFLYGTGSKNNKSPTQTKHSKSNSIDENNNSPAPKRPTSSESVNTVLTNGGSKSSSSSSMHTASSSLTPEASPPSPKPLKWDTKQNSLSTDEIHIARTQGDRTWLTGGRTYPNLADEAAYRGSMAPKFIQDKVELQALSNDLSGKSRFNRDYFTGLKEKYTPKKFRQRGMTRDEKYADDLQELNRIDNRRLEKSHNKQLKKIRKEEKEEEKRIKKDQKDHQKHLKKQAKLDKKQAKLDKKYGQEATKRNHITPDDDVKIKDMSQSEYRKFMQQEAFWTNVPKKSRARRWTEAAARQIASAIAIGVISGGPLWLVSTAVECQKSSGNISPEIFQACMFRSPETLEELKNQFLNETMNGTLTDPDRERDEFRNTVQEAIFNVTEYIKNADKKTTGRLNDQDNAIFRMNTALTMLRNQIRYNDPGMHITRNGGVPIEYVKLAYKFDVDSILEIALVSEQFFWSHVELMTECSDYSEALIAWIQEEHGPWAQKMHLLNQLIFREAKFQARKYGHDDFNYRSFQNGLVNCKLPMDPPEDYVADPYPQEQWDIEIPEHIRRLSRFQRRKRSITINTPEPDTSDIDETITTLATYEMDFPETQKRLHEGKLSYVTMDEWNRFINYGQPQNGDRLYLPLMICITVVVIILAALATRIYLSKSKTQTPDPVELEPLKPIIKLNAKITEQTPFTTAV